jgi:hypothetical protein
MCLNNTCEIEEARNFHIIDEGTSWKIDASFMANTGPLPAFDTNYWFTVGIVDKRKCKSAEAALKYFKKLKVKKESQNNSEYEE